MKREMKKLALYCLVPALLLGASAALGMPPQGVELSFEIRFGNMKLGIGEDRLEHDGKRYQVHNDTIPKGIAAIFIDEIRRESKGSITTTGLRPDSFVERGRKDGIRSAEFDWTNNKLQKARSTRPACLTRSHLPARFPKALAFMSLTDAG